MKYWCYVSSSEKEIENAAGKTGQDIKWQMKRLCPSMWFAKCTKIHIKYNVLIFRNLGIRQSFGPGDGANIATFTADLFFEEIGGYIWAKLRTHIIREA
jgi:hypothetical protein